MKQIIRLLACVAFLWAAPAQAQSNPANFIDGQVLGATQLNNSFKAKTDYPLLNWTTASRPGCPPAGGVGFNTQTGTLEYCNGNSWVSATGSPSGGINRYTYIDVKSDFNAAGDSIMLGDGVITSGTNVLNSATANFTQADVGKSIAIEYAASGTAPLVTTISGVNSPTQVTLAANATNTTGRYFIVALTAIFSVQTTWSGYRPGQTVSDGTTTATVDATKVVAVPTVVANGTGGLLTATGATSGTCRVKGRTGNGQDGPTVWSAAVTYAQNQLVTGSDNLTYASVAANNLNHDPTGAAGFWVPASPPGAFEADVTLVSGAIDPAVPVVVTVGGSYTTNPFNIAAEPVLPIDDTGSTRSGCRGLTGAIVSVNMGVALLRPTTKGLYTSNPATAGHQFCQTPNPTCTTSPAGGTNGIFGIQSVLTGAFVYGTDDTSAFTSAFTVSNTLNSTGVAASCVFVPTGKYWIGLPLPRWTSPGCVKGVSDAVSELIVSPNMSGDLLSWRDSWNGAAVVGGQIVNDTSFAGGFANKSTGGMGGGRLENIKLTATRNSVNTQHAIAFYDRNTYFVLDHVFAQGFNGSCFATGRNDLTTRGGLFESELNDFHAFFCGNASHPAVSFDSQSTIGQGTNNIRLHNWNIFANYGHGMSIRASGGFNNGVYHMVKLRIEGVQFGPVLFANGEADQLHIGDPADGAGKVALIVCIDCTLTTPYLNNYALRLSAGPGVTNSPSGIDFQGQMNGNAGDGGGLKMSAGFGNSFYMRAFATPGCDVSIDNSAGGANFIWGPAAAEKFFKYCVVGPQNRLGHWLVTTEVPQPFCTLLSGLGSAATPPCFGTNSAILGGIGGLDRGRTGMIVFPSNASNLAGLPAQRTLTTMYCFTSGAAPQAPCTPTADTQLSNAANCINIPDNTSFSIKVDVQVQNLAAPTQYYTAAWSNAHVLSRGVGAGTTLLNGAAATVAPDTSRVNGANMGTTTIAPDTTNGCLRIVHTPGAANANLLGVKASVTTLE